MKAFNTTIDDDLLKELKILAIKQDKPIYKLIHEAIKLVLDKYR